MGTVLADGPHPSMLSNMTAGLVATMLSSPLNYARNIKYATPPTQKPLSTLQVGRPAQFFLSYNYYFC